MSHYNPYYDNLRHIQHQMDMQMYLGQTNLQIPPPSAMSFTERYTRFANTPVIDSQGYQMTYAQHEANQALQLIMGGVNAIRNSPAGIAGFAIPMTSGQSLTTTLNSMNLLGCASAPFTAFSVPESWTRITQSPSYETPPMYPYHNVPMGSR
jgi:hypothetical protein